MYLQQILEACADGGARLARFLYCDSSGLIRGKATAMPGLETRLTDGIGLTRAMMAMNQLDQLQPVVGVGPVGEVRLVPDLSTFSVVPYVPGTASFLCDMLTADREPWAACPRDFLKRMRARAANAGFHLQAAFEAEFILARKSADGSYEPFDSTCCFSTIAMDQAAPFVDDLVRSLESQFLQVEQYYPEAAHGQHEISIHHAEALRAADNHLKLRDTIRGVAWKHGLYASLAPKPFPDDVGSGAHLHFSLWDAAGKNVFSDPDKTYCLSDAGRHFLAGVLAHLPALLALTCPSVNSYRRLLPGWWSSAYAAYGPDNREAALRIASPFWSDPAGSVNLELKPCDSSCNPYLALGGLMAAGLDGLERKLEPGDAVEVDPNLLSPSERSARGIRRLPQSLDESLNALERDGLLTDAMGPLLTEAYLAVRRSEATLFRNRETRFELDSHFYRY